VSPARKVPFPGPPLQLLFGTSCYMRAHGMASERTAVSDFFTHCKSFMADRSDEMMRCERCDQPGDNNGSGVGPAPSNPQWPQAFPEVRTLLLPQGKLAEVQTFFRCPLGPRSWTCFRRWPLRFFGPCLARSRCFFLKPSVHFLNSAALRVCHEISITTCEAGHVTRISTNFSARHSREHGNDRWKAHCDSIDKPRSSYIYFVTDPESLPTSTPFRLTCLEQWNS
jgi:hypothetical protein